MQISNKIYKFVENTRNNEHHNFNTKNKNPNIDMADVYLCIFHVRSGFTSVTRYAAS